MNEIPYTKLAEDVALRISSLAEWFKLRLDAAIAANDVKTAFELFDAMKTANKTMDEARSSFGSDFESFNKGKMPEFLDSLGTDMVRVPELARSFYTTLQMSATVCNKELAFEWLKENGGEGLIQPTVNASTLKSFVKSKLEEDGVEPPEDVIKISTYRAIGSSKYTVK